MPATTRNQDTTIARRALLIAAALVVGFVVTVSTASASANRPTNNLTTRDARDGVRARGPQLVRGAIADVLVRVRGGGVCSGTPITDTVYVVTAAHCVLDRRGHAGARTVVRDGITYAATAVLVDDRYTQHPQPQRDAAVLVLDAVMPGPSATVGVALPSAGSVTIAGFQALDSDGTLLRGKGPHDVLVPKGATGSLIKIESAAAGCTVPTASLSITTTRVDVRCGLIPGASGGGLFVDVDRTMQLVGIVSTVSADLTSNGVVPLESLHELLRHPERYRHDVRAGSGTGGRGHVARS